MPETMCDVVMMVDAFGEVDEPPNPLPRHVSEEVSLAPGIVLGPLREVQGDLLKACDPRGINWEPPHKSYGVNYLFIREEPPAPYFSFDPDNKLWTCVQLSRLIRPTSISFGKAGRLTVNESDEVIRFAPSRIDGAAGRAWIANPEENWIRDDDVEPLRRLIERFDADSLPERVIRALWQHEFVHQIPFVDKRWPMAVTGLESLVHTDRRASTKQFVVRLLGVQERLGVTLADEATLERIYDRRSAIAHGKRIGELDELGQSDYLTLERLLRTTVVRAILDSTFSQLFANAERVRKEWPVESK